MVEVCAQAEAQRFGMREDRNHALSPTEKGGSAMESPGDSLDSDMMSISSDTSECTPFLDPEDPLAPIIDMISRRVFDDFKKSQRFRLTPQSEHTGNGGPADTSGNSSVSCVTSQSHGMEGRRTGKRGRSDGEDEDWDEGGFRKPPRPTKRPALSPSRPRRRTLACPFWKLNPQTHRLCFHRKFNRISDVKLHLNRKHKLPATEYCQRCWIAFEGQRHKEGHLRDPRGQGCQYNPAARPVGIDNNMAAALHKKSNPSLSTEDQWFAIWDIAFPDQPRPSSPYVNDSLSEDATQLEENIVNQWPSILASAIEEARRSNLSVDTDRLEPEHVIRATINRLLDDFSAEQETMRAVELGSNHQSPGARTASSSNRADSAIDLESYQLDSHSSSNSGDEVSLPTTGAAVRQPEAHTPVPNHSGGVMYRRRERPILPSGQDTAGNSYVRQEMSRPVPSFQGTEQHIMPAPTTSQMVAAPDLANMQATEGGDHSFGTDLMFIDPTLPLTDDWLQASQENGEFNGDVPWDSMEIPTDFNWAMLDMEGSDSQSQPGTSGG